MTDKKDEGRKSFDYQERWHGFGSPVGNGIGFALFGLGLLLIAGAIWVFSQIR